MNQKLKGNLFVFEGPDGVGKSTILREVLKKVEIESKRKIELVAFPGNEKGTLGKLIYDIHHHHDSMFNIKHINTTSIQTLHIASHIDTIESKIKPKLKDNYLIFLDRFWWSTLVYGKILNVNIKALDLLIKTELTFWENIKPDGIFLISTKSPLKKVENNENWEKLKEEYKTISSKESKVNHVHVIENNKPISETTSNILDYIRKVY